MDRPTPFLASPPTVPAALFKRVLGLTLVTAALFAVVLLYQDLASAGVNEPSWSEDTGDWVNDVAISDDGRYVATGSYNGQIYLYDMDDSEDGEVIIDYTSGGEIKDVDISSDGRMLVAVSSDGDVYRFDRDSVPFPSTPVMAKNTGNSMISVDISDFNSDVGAYYYVAGTALEHYSNDRIYFYSTASDTSEENGYYRAEQNGYTVQAKISDDGMWAASLGGRYYHYWWNNTDEDNTGYHRRTSYWSTTPRNYFRSIAESGNGEWSIIGKENGGVTIIARNGSSDDTMVGESGNHVNAVDVTEDAAWYVIGGKDGSVWLFNETLSRKFTNDTGNPVYSVDITPDGKRFAAGNQLKRVFHYYPEETNPDGEGDDVIYWWYKTGGYVQSVAVSDDGDWTAAGVSDDDNDNVFYFDAEGAPNQSPDAFIDHVYDEEDNDLVTAAFEGTNVTFEGHGEDADGRITEHKWESSIDGVLATKSNFKTDTLTRGDHIIYYSVKDDEGKWSSESTWDMAIHNPPTGEIDDISPSPAFEGEDVDFEGSGEDDGSIVAYEWISDKDGPLSDKATFTHQFNGVKTHTITFRVQDNNGAWSEADTAYIDINEKPNNPPTATIQSVSPDPAMVGQEVLLKGKGEDQDGHRIDEHEWYSSLDGELGIHATTRAFLSEGTHTLTYRVKDQKGDWSEEDTYELEVQPALVAVLTLLRFEAEVGEEITISGASSQGDIAEYWFDFGDGSTPEWVATDKVVHIYENEGTYQIRLQVRNSDNVEADEEATRMISIKKKTVAADDDDGGGGGGGGDSPGPGAVMVALVMLGSAYMVRRNRG